MRLCACLLLLPWLFFLSWDIFFWLACRRRRSSVPLESRARNRCGLPCSGTPCGNDDDDDDEERPTATNPRATATHEQRRPSAALLFTFHVRVSESTLFFCPDASLRAPLGRVRSFFRRPYTPPPSFSARTTLSSVYLNPCPSFSIPSFPNNMDRCRRARHPPKIQLDRDRKPPGLKKPTAFAVCWK